MFPGQITQQPADYLRTLGSVFATFDTDTQDSGNISYGVDAGTARYFCKTAGFPEDPKPYSNFETRQQVLRNAARLAGSVQHELLPQFHALIESPAGPILVYTWRDGDHLGTSSPGFDRFRALPPDEILATLDRLYDLHAQLTAAGWVAGDFYAGSLLYDFAGQQLTAMDLDHYHHGAYRNGMGRMFGSTQFMAPEEHSLGAPIDDRTTAYVMARTALVLLSDGTLDRPPFRGTDTQYAVLQEATTTRYPGYTAFHGAWLQAR